LQNILQVLCFLFLFFFLFLFLLLPPFSLLPLLPLPFTSPTSFSLFFAKIIPAKVLSAPRVPLWDFFLQKIQQGKKVKGLPHRASFGADRSPMNIFFFSHKPRRRRRRRRNEKIRGRRERRRKRKKKKRSCRIFWRKKSHKGTLGTKSTLVGFFLAKKKLKVCPIELLLA
jgi:hypothetical protein